MSPFAALPPPPPPLPAAPSPASSSSPASAAAEDAAAAAFFPFFGASDAKSESSRRAWLFTPISLLSAARSISSMVMSISGSTLIDSHASSEFSTSSRTVVYSDLPGLSKPAMFLFSEKNSAGDLKRRTSPREVEMTGPSLDLGGMVASAPVALRKLEELGELGARERCRRWPTRSRWTSRGPIT